MTATLRFRTLAWIGVLESAKVGLDAWKARTRDVIKDSGDEWKEKVSDRPESVLGLPWGRIGRRGTELMFRE